MEYNSGRPKMIIPEYGRHIQKMVDFATNIEDRDERNKCAQAIIAVMGQLNPHLRDVADFKHKLWDHLFIMSNFTLDVDSPYDKPSIEILNEKPEIVPYPQSNIRYRHYGKIIQDLVKKAVDHEEGKDKEQFVVALLNLMKRTYLAWNNNSVSDEVIVHDLKALSSNKLVIPSDFEFENTSEILARNFQQKKRRRPQPSNGKQNFRRPKKN
jgi:hypothetical protein